MSLLKTTSLFSFFVCILTTACKKSDVNDHTTPPPTSSGVVTAVGIPNGQAVSKTIGAAGGSLASADGQLTLDVPAGAVQESQSFSIQPITNNTPMGLKKAYRLTPHGLTFSKPVTLTFAFTDDDIKGSVPEALGIAYQDKDGIWKGLGAARVNKTAKTVTVTTTHFSDWALFESFCLKPTEAIVPVGSNLDLTVEYCVEDDGLIVPIPDGKEAPLTDPKELAADYVKKWTLVGDGILGSRQNKAVYTAPDQVPTPNPVTINVSLDLKVKGQFILVGRITVINKETVVVTASAGLGTGTFTLSGTPQAMHVASANRTRLSAYLPNGTNDNSKYIEILFPSLKGDYLWHQDGNVTATYIVRKGSDRSVYNSIYADKVQWYDSPGGISITNYGEVGEYITGTFSIEKSGYANGNETFTPVAGWFAVKRGPDTPN